MIARPVPPGATVIAKPIVPGQHSDPLPLQIPHQIIPEDLKKSNAPKAMVWTTHHPEGQLVMLETFFFQTNFYVKNRSFISRKKPILLYINSVFMGKCIFGFIYLDRFYLPIFNLCRFLSI